jgi:phage replication-related protein YjqB (UPF0714/DUF867 family)
VLVVARPYQDFTELVLNAVKERDYRVHIIDRGADVTVAAIHGGSIEPLTSELAASIAGEEHNLYELRGLSVQGHDLLRVPVQRFDEIRLYTLVRRSRIALSIQGAPGSDPSVHLGGKNRRLKHALEERLREAGFDVRSPATPGAAHDPQRFFNAATEGGIQMELTQALRVSLVDAPLEAFLWEDPAHWNDRFSAFVIAVRGALEQYRTDLERALARFEHTTQSLRKALPGCEGSDHEH